MFANFDLECQKMLSQIQYKWGLLWNILQGGFSVIWILSLFH